MKNTLLKKNYKYLNLKERLIFDVVHVKNIYYLSFVSWKKINLTEKYFYFVAYSTCIIQLREVKREQKQLTSAAFHSIKIYAILCKN